MLTRAAFDACLALRVGKALAAAGLTGPEATAVYGDALAEALRRRGWPVAQPFAATDGDLAGVPDAEAGPLADLAELRSLETLQALPPGRKRIREDDYEEERADPSAALAARVAALRDRIRAEQGIGATSAARLSFGVHNLDFAARTDDDD